MNSTTSDTPGNPIDRQVATNSLVTAIRVVVTSIAAILITRFTIAALGIEAFGVYVAIAAVPLGLSFLTASMSIASQRSLTMSLGKNERTKLFSALLGIHFVVSLFLLFVCELAASLALEGLDIPESMSSAAFIVMQVSIFAAIVGALLAPFEAVFLAEERFGVLAALDILRAVILLIGSYWLLSYEGDRLIAYTLIVAATTVTSTIAGAIVAMALYPVCRPHFTKLYNKAVYTEQFRLFSWATFGSLSAVARSQGFIILINILFGPVGSAAFAVGNQIVSAVRQLATTVTRVFTPRIYKVEATTKRQEMIQLAFSTSKYTTIAAILITVPLIFEMEYLVTLWLDEVPAYALSVAIILLIAFVMDQLSAPVGVAHMATGQVARYYLTCGLTGISALPLGYALGLLTDEPVWALASLVITSTLVAGQRVWLLGIHTKRPLIQWLRETLAPTLMTVIPSIMAGAVLLLLMPPTLPRLLTVTATCGMVTLIAAFYFAMDSAERTQLRALFRFNAPREQ